MLGPLGSLIRRPLPCRRQGSRFGTRTICFCPRVYEWQPCVLTGSHAGMRSDWCQPCDLTGTVLVRVTGHFQTGTCRRAPAVLVRLTFIRYQANRGHPKRYSFSALSHSFWAFTYFLFHIWVSYVVFFYKLRSFAVFALLDNLYRPLTPKPLPFGGRTIG